MSIYADSSQKYWTTKKKSKQVAGRTLVYVLAIIFILSCVSWYKLSSSTDVQRRSLVEDESNYPMENRKRCLLFFKTNQNQCQKLCADERKRSPRPTMLQACMYGCSNGHLYGAERGCTIEDNSEIDIAPNEISNIGYQQCKKYQDIIPRPEIFSTCRNYHSIAAQQTLQSIQRFRERKTNSQTKYISSTSFR